MTQSNREAMYKHLLKTNQPIPASLEAEFGKNKKEVVEDKKEKKAPKKASKEV